MLEGNKVKLKTVRKNDLEELYTLRNDNLNTNTFYHYNIDSYSAFFAEFEKTGFWEYDDGLMLIINKEGKNIVGEIQFFKGLSYQSGYEIGYRLFKNEYFNKGYMTEALKLFISYLFKLKPINRLQINIMQENIASRKVVEKCGFEYEGMMRNATFHDGKYHNLLLFSILR